MLFDIRPTRKVLVRPFDLNFLSMDFGRQVRNLAAFTSYRECPANQPTLLELERRHRRDMVSGDATSACRALDFPAKRRSGGFGGGGGMNYGENERQEEADGRKRITRRRRGSYVTAVYGRSRWQGPRSRNPRSTVCFDCLPGNQRRDEPTGRPNERTKRQAGWVDLPTSCQSFVSLGCRLSSSSAAVAESSVRSADVSFHQAFVPKIGYVRRGTGYFSQGKFTLCIFLAAVHI